MEERTQPAPPAWFIRFSVAFGAFALATLIARQFIGTTPSLPRNVGMGLIALSGLSAPLIKTHGSPFGYLQTATLGVGVILLYF